MSFHYYLDASVLLKHKPLVKKKFIIVVSGTYWRIFYRYLWIHFNHFHCCLWKQSVFLHNKTKITRWLDDTSFISS